jgi:hypothetical protein
MEMINKLEMLLHYSLFNLVHGEHVQLQTRIYSLYISDTISEIK